MRLLNTTTELFEKFVGLAPPKYAILSHTWEEEEVSFMDMKMDQTCRPKRGYEKISRTCRKASHAGFSYVWIDTCCIDKSDSAELAEAINSMYKWYQRAEVCYVFLSDLSASAPLDTLKSCRWFTRGWTLQELIVPRNMFFFDQDWNMRGSKKDLIDELSRITNISAAILQGSQLLSSVAVAQKMSWAAYRKTTRVEDMAYCLLGIFGVNMPLLYGEEHRAFRRLQEQIIRTTPDFSIFAWRLQHKIRPPNSSNRVVCGILAETPLCFAESNSVWKDQWNTRQEFSMTNVGVKVKIRLLTANKARSKGYRYILPLNCSQNSKASIGILVRKCGLDQFVRADPWNFEGCPKSVWLNETQERYFLADLPGFEAKVDSQCLSMDRFISQTRSHVLQIDLLDGMVIRDAWPPGGYDYEDQCFFLSGNDQWDLGAVKIFLYLEDPESGRHVVEIMFYASGWSSLDIRDLQGTILNYQSVSSLWSEMQNNPSTWNPRSFQGLESLQRRKFPKTSTVRFELPGTTRAAMISFTPTLQKDPEICENEIWKIKFSFEFYNEGEFPEIPQEEWYQAY